MKKNFIFAVATLVGAIVGLGMFGIPYTASKAGFFVGVGYIAALGIVMLLIHLIYGEVVERTEGNHRFTGYVEKYLGGGYKKILGILVVLTLYTALLAYSIVAGKFLELLLPGLMNPFVWSIIFWFILSVGIWRGIRAISKVELLMSGFLIAFVFILLAWGAPDIRMGNFTPPDIGSFFLPYGVVLFALDGIFAIPEIREVLKIDGKRYRSVIIWGTLVPIVLYVLFAIVVVGISGANTSEEALGGLVKNFGGAASQLGALFGIFAIVTSFLVLGSNLKHTFQYDWHMPRSISTMATTLVPVLLFVGGVQQFIEVISISGGVFGSLLLIFVLLVYRKALVRGDKKPGYALRLPKFVIYGLIALFIFGGIYEIIYLLT